MADIAIEIEDLKKTINDVLSRYVPLDDRSLVLDKIESAMSRVLGSQKEAFDQKLEEIQFEINAERNKVRSEVEGIRTSAVNEFEGIHGKIRKAYEEGLADGAVEPQAQTPTKSNMLNIALGAILVILVGIFVIGGLNKKS